jgi:hypothetical protein
MLAPPRPWWDSVPIAFAWRYLCHSIMIGLALVNERRPAPNLPDLLLDLIPRVDWIARHNYHLWVACYLPLAFWLWRRDRAAFVHFLYVGGLLSLLRGVCIPLTGLGPVEGPDVNAGMSWATIGQAWWALVNPISALTSDAAHVHLTKDLFFSGHTATTFLMWLYCRGRPVLGSVALSAHLFTVFVVFAARLHYTVDVIGALALTYCLYSWAVRRWPPVATVR